MIIKQSFLGTFLLYFILLVGIKSIEISLNDISINRRGGENTHYSYIIESNVLTLTENGDFKISGTCIECQIEINSGLEINLTLDSISIITSKTSPFIIGENATVYIILVGKSLIFSKELKEKTVLEDFGGAGIKFKKSSSLTIGGKGILKIYGTHLNGIEGEANSLLTINNGTIIIYTEKSALVCDNLLTINGGLFILKSNGNGILAEPDSDDSDSQGTIEINGGIFLINSQSDAIHAGYKLMINGGTFDIKTNNQTTSKDFDTDTMSAKGLKCSTNKHEDIKNIIIISKGVFTLNTRDVGIYSDYDISISGGIFEINTTENGIHANNNLIIGQLNDEKNLLYIKIKSNYEGLKGANIYIYSAIYKVSDFDDKIKIDENNEALKTVQDEKFIKEPKPYFSYIYLYHK